MRRILFIILGSVMTLTSYNALFAQGDSDLQVGAPQDLGGGIVGAEVTQGGEVVGAVAADSAGNIVGVDTAGNAAGVAAGSNEVMDLGNVSDAPAAADTGGGP